MPKIGDDMQYLISQLGITTRCRFIGSKLNDRQLINAIDIFNQIIADREKKKQQQEQIIEKRQAFLERIKKESAELDMGPLTFEDHQTGKTITLKNTKKTAGLKRGMYKKRYFVADKYGHCFYWNGGKHIPKAFIEAGFSEKTKSKFLSEKIFVLNKSFSEEILNNTGKAFVACSDFPKVLETIKPTAQGKKNAAKLLKLLDDKS